MAILPSVPGLEIQIVVNDDALHEYEDHTARVSKGTVERYVEAQSNVHFEVRYAFRPPFPADRAVSMIVTIDGEDMDEPLIRPFELFDTEGHVSCGPVGEMNGQWVVRKYRFSPIHIRESSSDEVSDALKKKLEPVGIISCQFYFLDNPKCNRTLRSTYKAIEQLPPVSEKALKGDALSHQATLGVAELAEEIQFFDAEYADDGKPFASFHFYYRSLAALKDLHILSRTPEPIDLLYDDDTPLGQLNREQLEYMVRRFREQEDARLRLKRERSLSGTIEGGDYHDQQNDPEFVELGSVDLRAERRAKRVRQMPTPGSEVIDLDG